MVMGQCQSILKEFLKKSINGTINFKRTTGNFRFMKILMQGTDSYIFLIIFSLTIPSFLLRRSQKKFNLYTQRNLSLKVEVEEIYILSEHFGLFDYRSKRE